MRTFSHAPRRIIGLDLPEFREGTQADFVIFNPEGSTHVTPETMASKSRNTPFLGSTLAGSVDDVILGAETLLSGKVNPAT